MKIYRSPYQERRRKVGWDLYKILGIKKGDYKKTLEFHSQNYSFFDAPNRINLFYRERFRLDELARLWYVFTKYMSCCRSFGLHTCPQAAWGLVYKKANKVLKLKKIILYIVVWLLVLKMKKIKLII